MLFPTGDELIRRMYPGARPVRLGESRYETDPSSGLLIIPPLPKTDYELYEKDAHMDFLLARMDREKAEMEAKKPKSPLEKLNMYNFTDTTPSLSTISGIRDGDVCRTCDNKSKCDRDSPPSKCRNNYRNYMKSHSNE